jgi:hypothetical protein
MSLTQSEADALLVMEKKFVNTKLLRIGDVPMDESHELESLDQREKFVLDIWRCGINLAKYKLQNRSRVVYLLARIDIGGPPHQNPDFVKIPCPHIHIYREGYDDKWAYPLSDYGFRNPDDIMVALEDFARFCNIIKLPPCQMKYVK